jgi:hypothetical protein
MSSTMPAHLRQSPSIFSADATPSGRDKIEKCGNQVREELLEKYPQRRTAH